MRLYYHPGACSLAPHIVLREIGETFGLSKVDLVTKRTEDGVDFLEINPRGYVPALQLDDGEVLTEGVAIMQYLADTHPEAGLAPAAGSLSRARLQSRLNFLAAELHKAFAALFGTKDAAGRTAALTDISRRLDQLEADLADGRAFLGGDAYSLADAYLFVMTRWSGLVDLSLEPWPRLVALADRVGARPAVQAALVAEGILEPA